MATKYLGDYYYGQCEVSDWKDIVAVSAGEYYTVGLKKDGTVVATKLLQDIVKNNYFYEELDVSSWNLLK